MIRVGLDLRRASPRLRRWVTLEASTRCKAPRPLRAVDLPLRQGPSGAAALRALGPATLRVHYVEVDQLEDALGHAPVEGVAPAQVELVAEAPAEDMLRAATGIAAWLRFEGDALVASAPPLPPKPGGTPVALKAA